MSALHAALFVLVCTAIGWLIGSAVLGLVVGLVVVVVALIPLRRA